MVEAGGHLRGSRSGCAGRGEGGRNRVGGCSWIMREAGWEQSSASLVQAGAGELGQVAGDGTCERDSIVEASLVWRGGEGEAWPA